MKKTYVFPMIFPSYVLDLVSCEGLAESLQEN